MKINLAELDLIIDCLHGSLKIADGTNTIWSYGFTDRKRFLDNLVVQMHKVELNIEVSNTNSDK